MSLRQTVLACGTPAARRLRLRVPDSPPPAEGWPLLVLLDGDWLWPLPLSSGPGPACAILLPGHDQGPDRAQDTPDSLSRTDGRQQILARRTLDYTPPAPDGSGWPDPRRPEWSCGGADAFLDALLGPMLDWAGTQTRLNPARRSLYGHSYGGLCALYALIRHPGRFDHTICASPSLWWRDGWIEALLDGLPAAQPRAPDSIGLSPLPSRPVRLTLMAGTHERWYSSPADPAHPRHPDDGIPTLPRLEALCQRLMRLAWLDCALEPLDGIHHGDALRAGALRAVTLAAA
ncbi:MAG: alpha/beta hydrolase [Castellaniella sp.]|uniref:alpha/beta hydrolase n=1 Tax=Castellaniella sp. TaxID=1955812 RepID=UPI003A885D5E